MRATGIVRRIDDLGRVVIPKEIRRNFGIREGDPLEISTSKEGIMLRRYDAFNQSDFEKARDMVRVIIPNTAFAILDNYGNAKSYSSYERFGNLNLDNIHQDKSLTVYTIYDFSNVSAYLVIANAENVIPEKIQTVRDILKVVFSE